MIPRLCLTDETMPGVRMSAEVTPSGELVILSVRDESIPARPAVAGIVLGREGEQQLREWLEKVSSR